MKKIITFFSTRAAMMLLLTLLFILTAQTARAQGDFPIEFRLVDLDYNDNYDWTVTINEQEKQKAEMVHGIGRLSPNSNYISVSLPEGAYVESIDIDYLNSIDEPIHDHYGDPDNSIGNSIEFVVNDVSENHSVNVTFFVHYPRYTVKFFANGGSGSMDDQTFVVGVSQNLKNCSFTREDYTFAGWAESQNGNAVYSDGKSVTNLAGEGETKNLYATWSSGGGVTYAVTFDMQGGSGGTSSVDATYNEPMPPIEVPTLTNYAFDGYFTQANGQGTKYYNADGSSAKTCDLTEATTLYANWVEKTYTVTLVANGGSGGTNSVTVKYGESMPAITVPSRPGYTFGGYYGDNGTGYAYYSSNGNSVRTYDLTTNTSLYAIWTVNTYTVNLDSQEGSGGTTSVTATYGAAMPSATMPTREGYIFGGYFTGTNGEGTKYYNADGSSARTWNIADDNTTLYAKWTPITYTVNFNANGGTGDAMSNQTFTVGVAQNLSTCTYTRTGYTFDGWATTEGGNVEYTNGQEVSNLASAGESLTLYAHWTPITFTVIFDKNGGQGDQMPNQTFTYDETQHLRDYSYFRNGYTFDGWAIATDGDKVYDNGQEVSNLTTTADGTVTLYAHWTPITYTVNFNANGGDGDQMASQAFTYDAAQNLIACTYTHTGYTFAGWATTDDGDAAYTNGQNVNNLTTTADATLTLFAKWTPITYTVNFHANGGQGDQMPNQAFTYDAVQNLNPLGYSRNGYTFDGWAITANGDKVYDDYQEVSNLTTTAGATVELYAKWTSNTYTVRFAANGGDGDQMADQAFTYDAAQNLTVCTYTRTGYTFAGWATIDEGDVAYTNGQNVNNLTTTAGATVMLFAKWTPISYTVTFNANGGQGDQMPNQAFTYDSAQKLTVCTYTRTGYTFAGWATTAEGDVAYTNGQNVNNLITTADATVMLFAKWTPISYTVRFAANGGDGGDQMADQAFTYDAAQDLTACTYTRTGYTFAGWATTAEDDVEYTNEENVNNLTTTAGATVEFFAKWTPITYTVTFNANGGQGDQMPNQAFTYDAAQNLNPLGYSRNGYTFDGWAITANGDKVYDDYQEVSNLTTTAGATVELYAKWTSNTYTVRFAANGGDGGDQMADQAFIYDAAQDLTASTYTRTGYTFAGWATTAEGDVAYTNGQNVNNLTTTADATVMLFAKWTPISYTVTFDRNGGDGGDQMADQAFTYDEAQNLRDCSYTLTGYTFAGWAMTPDGDVAYTNGQNVNNLTTTAGATVMLFAKWTPITYTVTFDRNGGQGDQMPNQAFTYDSAQKLNPLGYSRNGYTFAGWAMTPDGDVAYTNEENVNNLTTTAGATVEFFAKWTPITYTVNFHANGGDGSQMSDQAFTYDEAQNLRDCSYTLPGYAFAGWAMTPDGDVAYTNEENVNNLTTTAGVTVELYAKWTPITYTVNFHANGGDGSQMSDQAFTYDEAQNLRDCSYTLTGYAFAGWAMTPDGDVAYDNGQEVSNLTTTAGATVMLFAKWTPITYTVTFDKNGGDGSQMSDQAFTYDEAQNLRDCSYTLTGYTFAGWATTVDGDVEYTNGQNVNNLRTAADATVELYAKWAPITYTVNFDKNGGDGDQMADQLFTYDAAQNLTTCTYTRTGYTFAGWTMTTDGAKVYDNGQEVNNLTITADATVMLFAKWSANTYTVILDRQGATTGSESVTATYDADMPVITPPTMVGYDFCGYFTETDGDGTKYYDANGTSTRPWDIDEATTLYAKWEIINFEIDDITYEWTSETTVKVVGYNGTSSSLVIPVSVEHNGVSYYVTEIGEDAFEGKRNLEAIDMSNCPITIIHARAFKDCMNLSSILLPASLTTIEEEAFSGSNLTVDLDDLLDKNISIGYHAFSNIGCLTGSLDDNDDNARKMELLSQARANNVTLSGRTLYKDGNWNTICLPFDVSDFTGTPLEDATVMTLDATTSGFEASTGTLNLNFNTVNSISAGIPYIIKWANGDTVDDPEFNGVTLSNTEAGSTTSGDGYLTFIGTYSPSVIYTSPATNLYLGDGNTLYYPSEAGYSIKAFRAYFRLNNGLTAGDPANPEQGKQQVRTFNLSFGDETSSIHNAQFTMHNEADAVYDLSGRKVNNAQFTMHNAQLKKGLYIVNGKKVVVK